MPARRCLPLLFRAFVFALAFLLILQSAAPAWAWGRLGHRVICPSPLRVSDLLLMLAALGATDIEMLRCQ
jgi:hypothetical protein